MENEITIEKLTGSYNLEVGVPDGLMQKRLTIFSSGKTVLLEFEGGMAGAYQDYFIGQLTKSKERFLLEFKEYRGYSNFLVDDALDDDERLTIRPYSELFEVMAEEKDVVRLQFSRKGYQYRYIQISKSPAVTNSHLLDL